MRSAFFFEEFPFPPVSNTLEKERDTQKKNEKYLNNNSLRLCGCFKCHFRKSGMEFVFLENWIELK